MKRSRIPIVLFLLFILAFDSLAQKNSYPNELKGYEFYGRGKLMGLDLGKASKENIKAVFGEECTAKCDLDEKWSVEFDYFGDFSLSVGSGDGLREVVPKPAFVGKLYAIALIPKTEILLNENDFPAAFVRNGIAGTASHSDIITSYFVFQDQNGLTYRIFNRETGRRDASAAGTLTKGELVEIKYEIPDRKQQRMWIEKNKLN
jgi:hypothetical protein